MSEPEQYFHFTLGPVQGFVAQARRTRDFWAGSFLLSWLSAVAMQAVIKQQGKIIFPKISQDYLGWLENKGKSGTEPQQGCVPNRFKGGLAKVPHGFKPELVTDSIQNAWAALAEHVWQQDLSHSPAETRAIWDRQVKYFWEISWALSEDKTESNLLDRRKNWRNYLPPEEAGVKCMMMDGWQELSGIATPNAKGLGLFWQELREKGGTAIKTDLRAHEYLCAIAFIKRRFVHCFADLKVSMPNNWELHGWEVKSSVPSVTYIAAAPWLAQVLDKAPINELTNFHKEASQLTENNYNENKTNLKCIQDVINEKNDKLLFWKLKSLDGNVFFDAALENKNIYPDQTQAKQVARALSDLRKSVKETNIEPVSPFYAVLMMDGDSLGKQMSSPDKQKAISNSLNCFTNGVHKRVEERSGFLIYAGGDDVLAILPLEYALNCANELRAFYLQCFEENGEYEGKNGKKDKVKSTLSGAIEYAHIKMPLAKVLGDAHHLLNDIAKNTTGRDAIAVRVWKPGGQHLQWAMPWKKALNEQGQVIIDRLAQGFQQDQQETAFSNSFFFHAEERFASLQSKNKQGELTLGEHFNKDVMTKLIAAEYLNSVNSGINQAKKISLAQANARITPLLEQCFSIKRELDDNDIESFQETQKLNIKALQLIHFLAQKGVEYA